MRRHTLIPILMLGMFLVSAPSVGFAQSDDSGPALGVARVSLTNGDVTMQRGAEGDWVAAEVNSPLVEGDVIETAPGARAEVQLDFANFIRLDGGTTVRMDQLGDRRFRVSLLYGRLTYSELEGGTADIDIETEQVAVRPRENGRYEIEARQDRTVVQVRRGETEIASPEGIERLKKGRMMIVREDPNGELAFRETRDEPRGPWDEWNDARDDQLASSEAYRYVDRSISGAHDLDRHGDWRYVSGYGYCWYPTGVAAGWAPYRHGRWSWIDYYGWSWIGYEPWGWAPYHYGRWFHSASFGWGWYPGRFRYSHVWRPALVGFFGYHGRNFSVGVGFGNVGWVPLAPGERFYPWYGRGFRGRGPRNQTIIVDNSVNIYNNYRNARVDNGVTVVDANGFSRGQVNSPRSLRRDELQRASLVRGQIPVVPARESQGRLVRRASTGGAAARVGDLRRSTYTRGGSDASARVSRTPFSRQQARLERSVEEFRTGRSSVRAGGAESGTRAVRIDRGGSNRGSVRASGADRSGPSGADSRVARGGTSSDRGRPSVSVRGGSADSRTGWRSSEGSSVRSGGSSSRVDRGGSSSRVDRSVRSGDSRVSGSSRVDRGRSSSRVESGRSSSRVDRGRSSSRFPSSSRSRVDRSRSSSRVDRDNSSSRIQRSPSRVDRGRSSSRIDRSRSSPGFPSSSRSRVDRSRSSSRVDRSSRGSSNSPSRVDRGRSSVPRSQPRIDRGRSPSRPSGSVRPSRAPSSSRSSRIPRITNRGSSRPSPSRAPSVRSAPSRSRGGLSSRPSRAPSVRSAPRPSRAPSVRSAPSRSRGGSMRSAPSRGSSGRSGGSVRSRGRRGR